MKKFVFRLQIVLDRAIKEEEHLQQQLAHLRYELARKEQEIVENGHTRHALMQRMADTQQGIFDPQEIHLGHLQLEALGNDLVTLYSQRDAITARVTAKQSEVVEAMRKRQVLEKLREKQLAAYQREVERYELQNMEESVLPRLARQRKAEQACQTGVKS